MRRYRIGVDIGGTFTDFALFDDEQRSARTHKRLTTAADPAIAVIEGATALAREAGIGLSDVASVSHGTTLVTNAVIERKGAPAAMLTNRGFRDLLDIGQERRYDLFDLTLRFPPPIVARALRCEVRGRLRADGSEVEPLDLAGVESFLASAIERRGAEAVAICFLHSYANPAHERAAEDFVKSRFPQLGVSTSSSVFPFMREYARWTTTTVNAYVQPLIDRYLEKLESGLRRQGFRGEFLIMSSSGGVLTPAIARRFPVRLLESGPAAGALMSARHGRDLGFDHVLSFDMGGTTAKGCLIRGGTPLKRYDLEVARVHEFRKGSGLPVKIPVLDMIEIGAGGGSIAAIDERGVMRVGPQSAGADPGPACYGRGGVEPTLTDANLVLGYLDPRSFLGGAMALDAEAAKRALESLARPLRLDVARAAWGAHEIICEDVARAFRAHASERGIDTRRCAMIAFGGSGPIHAARVARKLRIPRLICPVAAGVMSAFGLLASPLAFETVRARRIALEDSAVASFAAELVGLEREASAMLREAGVAPADLRIRYRIDMRYAGQGHEIEISAADREEALDAVALRRLFEQEYRTIFGLAFEGRAAEIVNWKVEAEGPSPSGAAWRLILEAAARPALRGARNVWSARAKNFVPQPVYDRYALAPGATIEGPALIEERESTCVLGEGDRLAVDERRHLIIDVGGMAHA